MTNRIIRHWLEDSEWQEIAGKKRNHRKGETMNRGDSDKRKVDALIKILEGEVMLLRDAVDEAIHWDRPGDVREAIYRIRNGAWKIAKTLDVTLPGTALESSANHASH